MRNANGPVVYVEPPEGSVVDLTPVAFELYQQLAWARGVMGPGDAPALSVTAWVLVNEVLDGSEEDGAT